jgi:hypothetical protein
MLTLFRKSAFILAILILISSAAFADTTNTTKVPVTITVTALGPNYTPAPPISKEDISVYSGSTRLNVTRWERAHNSVSGNLQLAILIDGDLPTALLGQQLNDLASFIRALPPNTSVGVFYARNGSAYAAAPFGTDHEKAARSLHLTTGRNGDSPSIYLSLADLASHWPTTPSVARREVLLLSSGNDALNPGIQDPYFDSTVTKVQKVGIDVHTIYIAPTRYGLSFRGDISEGKLVQVTDESGGQALFNGISAPVSIQPFLTELTRTLGNQYLLTFTIDRSDKKSGELRPIKVLTEQHNVKISAPRAVLVPGP